MVQQLKAGDSVIGIRRSSGKPVKGIISRSDDTESYIVPADGDGFYCDNTDIKLISKYLVALPTFKGSKGFCHRTVLVSAIDEDDAKAIAKHLKPHDNIGDVKKVDY